MYVKKHEFYKNSHGNKTEAVGERRTSVLIKELKSSTHKKAFFLERC